MKLVFTEIIRFRSLLEPSQLQLERADTVTEIDNGKFISPVNSRLFRKSQGFFIKIEASLLVEDIKVCVFKCELHVTFSLYINIYHTKTY